MNALLTCERRFRRADAPDPRYAGGFGEASRPEIVCCEQCYNVEAIYE